MLALMYICSLQVMSPKISRKRVSKPEMQMRRILICMHFYCGQYNGFPAYVMLFGWSMKDKFVCPYCHKETNNLWLSMGKSIATWGMTNFAFRPQAYRNKVCFNIKMKNRESLDPLTGKQVLQQYKSVKEVNFGHA